MRTPKISNKYTRMAVSATVGVLAGSAASLAVAYALSKTAVWTGVKTVGAITAYVATSIVVDEVTNEQLKPQQDGKDS